MTTFATRPDSPRDAPKPVLSGQRSLGELVTIRAFLIIPFAALAAAVPLTWGWGMSWVDLMLAGVFYTISTLGVTVGYHRYFTHSAFQAKRWLRATLAVAGGLAAQGSVIGWVAKPRGTAMAEL